MGHYAKVQNGIVTKVIVADESFIATYKDNEDGEWIKTSYNTIKGKHYDPKNGKESIVKQPLRKNYAAIGFIYDSVRDAFYQPQPFDSWTLNEDSCIWEAPTPYPSDDKGYKWDEGVLNWVEIS